MEVQIKFLALSFKLVDAQLNVVQTIGLNVSKHYVVVSDESEAISKRDPILVEDK